MRVASLKTGGKAGHQSVIEAAGHHSRAARSASSQDSLGVVYDDAGEAKIVRPDFIFFARAEGGTVVADIVDPHGHHLADSLPKLRGLARYAEANAALFGRIEAVAEVDGTFRMLDLTNPEVRKGVALAASAKSAYAGPLGADYAH